MHMHVYVNQLTLFLSGERWVINRSSEPGILCVRCYSICRTGYITTTVIETKSSVTTDKEADFSGQSQGTKSEPKKPTIDSTTTPITPVTDRRSGKICKLVVRLN